MFSLSTTNIAPTLYNDHICLCMINNVIPLTLNPQFKVIFSYIMWCTLFNVDIPNDLVLTLKGVSIYNQIPNLFKPYQVHKLHFRHSWVWNIVLCVAFCQGEDNFSLFMLNIDGRNTTLHICIQGQSCCKFEFKSSLTSRYQPIHKVHLRNKSILKRVTFDPICLNWKRGVQLHTFMHGEVKYGCLRRLRVNA